LSRDIAGFRKGTTRARNLWRDGRYDDALQAVERLLES